MAAPLRAAGAGQLTAAPPQSAPVRAQGLRLSPNGFKFTVMDGTQQAAIHQALVSVQHAVTSMTFPSCDQEDLIEAIDRVEEQLHINHPNLALMCWFLNSIARSLRAQPEARDACLAIEDAIGKAGMPSTWQSGI
jgi:pyruvate/2-oxoglutarate dehydrogenase complex dihydrolipoamide acyltransferase (E2) component